MASELVKNTVDENDHEIIEKLPDKCSKSKNKLCNEKKIKAGTKTWPSTTVKLFLLGLKAYGKDFKKIYAFIRSKDISFDKPKCSLRNLFYRILERITKFLEKFSISFQHKLQSQDMQQIMGIYLMKKNRTDTDELRLIYAYGELYCSDLFPDNPKNHHIKKLYHILIDGSFSYMKNGKKLTIKIPEIKISDEEIKKYANSSFPENDRHLAPKIISMNRISLELRPKSLSVLYLMKQRAFNAYIKLDIPVDCKVSDVSEKL
ncbi:hypothetical protein MXB_5105, partial [Myxobolus squamalis]